MHRSGIWTPWQKMSVCSWVYQFQRYAWRLLCTTSSCFPCYLRLHTTVNPRDRPPKMQPKVVLKDGWSHGVNTEYCYIAHEAQWFQSQAFHEGLVSQELVTHDGLYCTDNFSWVNPRFHTTDVSIKSGINTSNPSLWSIKVSLIPRLVVVVIRCPRPHMHLYWCERSKL